MWSQLEPTPPHITYLTLAGFLILFCLFSLLIRDRLHLSEPPLAVLFGILLGPALLNIFSPHQDWGLDDVFTQEFTRLILGIQCFALGIELPAMWFTRRAHWRSVLWLLGPVMTYSWAATTLLARLVFAASWPTSMIIGACLSPTDPVLAASVLGASRFSGRVPRRLRSLLAAESACNDGASFPFLYVGLFVFEHRTAGPAVRDWVLVTVLYQCVLGLAVGYAVGWVANRLLRFSERRGYASRPSLVVFYLVLAVLCVGVGSTLGLDDFLVAFGAGIGFAHDGWFSRKAEEQGDVPFRHIVDLVLDSTVFVYFGSLIPWASFVAGSSPGVLQGHIGLGGLALFLALVLLFRRIPVVLALHVGRLIPDVKTYREALFCGHFGPMGVGALFLSIEARARLETGTSRPLPRPRPPVGPPYDDTDVAKALVWPVICFVVLGSTVVHGLSGLLISLGGHLSREEGERAPLLGGESEGLAGMVHDEVESDIDDEVGNGVIA
ncbi:hypothetical protein VPNG_02218 [Cytospora leucostoma]|uniref:Cation/H+ exchanger transmembrane domain-containing protein n=1 Tax=Cytospora leucostoma TaxID=1230097 RepID=A0A423XHB1_9PEZI|nr:hypothetical protein VPNG_02218 [Cytospora leucostoma]